MIAPKFIGSCACVAAIIPNSRESDGDCAIHVVGRHPPGADLENEKGGFSCMRTLRAGENFAQPRPFLSQRVLLTGINYGVIDCGAS